MVEKATAQHNYSRKHKTHYYSRTFPDENGEVSTKVHVENIFHFVSYLESIAGKKITKKYI